MTDLDTLRRALRASPQPEPQPEPAFDPAAIITRGRRLRWRRRAVAAGGGLCLGVAVLGAVAGVGRLTAPSPGPGNHPISPAGPAGAGTAEHPAAPRPVARPRWPRAVAIGQRVTHRRPDYARHQPGNANTNPNAGGADGNGVEPAGADGDGRPAVRERQPGRRRGRRDDHPERQRHHARPLIVRAPRPPRPNNHVRSFVD